ncbi:ATP-binding protein [Streptosporangium sp. NBC_01755]|uniref:ATP-binding protein n=1 Tax=unclassified Streptosporangium TaxID=2632669 RepID=UPI002DDA7C0F|nr:MULTISPECIES: ATP-binding protein [unclassified Streptosporangium]WSA28723.1 ATP-binding protein [Streptosporangium sp. NBC_01810]WSC99823.1 ATP-binding protein [Streptosporangium sp. NBC_01755]
MPRRARWIVIRTPPVKFLHTEIQIKLLANRNQPAGARRSVVIDGPPTVGKSTLVKMFAADFEQNLRRKHPENFLPSRRDGYVADYTPVVYLSIPSQATPKDLSAAFAEWFGIPLTRSNTKRKVTDLVLKALRVCGTELVIIDDIHYLHHRTSGSIASLSALIREGAIRAILTQEERLTRDILDTVVLDRRATRNYETNRDRLHPEPTQIGATA